MSHSRSLLLISGILLFRVPALSASQEAPTPSETASNRVVIDIEGGDRIHGQLVSEDDSSVVVVSPILGTVTLSRDRIERITTEGSEGDPPVDDAGADAAADEVADQAAEAIRGQFWCERFGCAYDRLQLTSDGWRPIMELRPNQLFLVSLPHGPLGTTQERSLVKVCRERLWTPAGMRTLDPLDAKYRGRFVGPIRELDAAYHNGTVWPWLIGPMAEAWLRAFDHAPSACAEARMLVQKLVDLVTDPEAPALGQLYEVYDGDTTPKPQSPGGCPAQAWSIAEVLRVLVMIRGCESAKA